MNDNNAGPLSVKCLNIHLWLQNGFVKDFDWYKRDEHPSLESIQVILDGNQEVLFSFPNVCFCP